MVVKGPKVMPWIGFVDGVLGTFKNVAVAVGIVDPVQGDPGNLGV